MLRARPCARTRQSSGASATHASQPHASGKKHAYKSAPLHAAGRKRGQIIADRFPAGAIRGSACGASTRCTCSSVAIPWLHPSGTTSDRFLIRHYGRIGNPSYTMHLFGSLSFHRQRGEDLSGAVPVIAFGKDDEAVGGA